MPSKPGGTDEPMVLVVDDDEAVRRMMTEYLRARRFPVITAGGGREALRMLETHLNVAVVLLDILLLDFGGIDTLADAHIAQQALGLGAMDYITKPPGLNEVEAAITAGMARSAIM